MRYSDALLVRNGTGDSTYCLCGLVYGIGSDMVLDYESTRDLKLLRYPYLKAKWGFFKKRIHEAKVHFVNKYITNSYYQQTNFIYQNATE